MTLESTATLQSFPSDAFADVLSGNDTYVESFVPIDRSGWADKGLAIITCMDSRVDPLRLVGMERGDAKILRNAGARVTDDVLRTLVLATYLLGVNRVLIMPHTDCKMASGEEAAVHQQIRDAHGIDTRSVEIRTVTDQRAALITDIVRVRAYPLLPADLIVGGAVFDVHSGRLLPMDA